MPEIRLDFRFSEINYELWGLSRYLDFMERYVPSLEVAEKERILSQVPNGSDNTPFLTFVFMNVDDFKDRIIPRLFRAPFIISLWSVFESGTYEITDYIRGKRNKDLELDDIRGDFLTRTKKYFKSVIQYQFCLDARAWEQLGDIACVRHVIAHANGRISSVNKKNQRRLNNIATKKIGITIEDDFLIIDQQFLRSSCEKVFSILNDLMHRVMTGFPEASYSEE